MSDGTQHDGSEIGEVRDVYAVEDDQVLAVSDLDTGSLKTGEDYHRGLRLVGIDRETGRPVRTTWLLTREQAVDLIAKSLGTYCDRGMVSEVSARLSGEGT